MHVKSNIIRIHKTFFFILIFILTLAIATPVLADYLGPDRTVTQTTGVCKMVLWEYQFVASKGEFRYRKVDQWSCGDEGKPWKAYSDTPSDTPGDQYYSTEESVQQTTVTHPPATVSGSLQNCNLNNGWCNTTASLALNGTEPLSGYNILAIEGSRNGETFGCSGSNCVVPLSEGDNSFTFWALSSWGDSSEMGALTAKVDTVSPDVGLDISGANGTNNWYVSPVSISATGFDSTSGLQSALLTIDNVTWQSSTTLNDGIHNVVVQAQDNAGNVSSSSTTISVDTTTPSISLNINGATGQNGWYISSMAVTANASDATSGVETLEVSSDGNAYQAYASAIPLTDGQHTLQFKAEDKAGNITETTIQEFHVDTIAPTIDIPASWQAGKTISYNVQDNGSGLTTLLLVIEDAEGKFEDIVPLWEEAVSGSQFSGEISWDGKFADGTDAPSGEYYVWVKAVDLAGNEQIGMGRVNVPEPNVVLSLFSSGTTSPTTPIPPVEFTNPSAPNAFAFPAPADNSNPLNTSNTSFGGNVSSPTESTRQSVTLMSGRTPPPAVADSNLLWGATAAAMLGAATAYALDERKKRKEEEAQQAAQVQAEVDAKNAAHQASLQAKIAEREALKIQGWLDAQALREQQKLDQQMRDLEMADMTEDERLAIHKQSAQYQSYQARMQDWHEQQAKLKALETADMTEQEHLAVYKQTAEYQARQQKLAEYHRQKTLEDFRAGEQGPQLATNHTGMPRFDPKSQTALDWLIGLYENDNMPGETAMDRTKYILFTTSDGDTPSHKILDLFFSGNTGNLPHTHFKYIARGDRGFDPQYQDSGLFPNDYSSDQVGHFLTGLDFGLWANNKNISSPERFLRQQVALDSIIGHEMVGDDHSEFAQWFVGFGSNLVTFGAVHRWFLSGEDKNFHKIVGDSVGLGNSTQDLGLTYQGWEMAEQILNGNIQTLEDFTQWQENNLK
jgi:hypothetical protein